MFNNSPRITGEGRDLSFIDEIPVCIFWGINAGMTKNPVILV